MKTLIEIHALQNFAPSNLNRDDTGAPKDALFGGTRRARVSSQCLKRAVRQHFAGLVGTLGWAADDVALRTKRVLQEVAEDLKTRGHDEADALEKVRQAFAAVELGLKEDGKSEYLLFLGRREIAGVARVIHEQWKVMGSAGEAAVDHKKGGKAKKKAAQGADPALTKALEAVFNGGKAVDVALFGRMLADMPENNRHAACQVAHAISTHPVEREFDFYTAVDDLKPDDTTGADMMGTVEFNSACFYRYAVVDWEKLLENLQGDRDLAARGLRGFLEGFIVAEPTGKQNTFAAHNPPEFVAISVRNDTAARNLANAFETAIVVRKGESLTRRSAEELARKGMALQTAFGGAGNTFVLNLTGANLGGFGSEVTSLDDLLGKGLSGLPA